MYIDVESPIIEELLNHAFGAWLNGATVEDAELLDLFKKWEVCGKDPEVEWIDDIYVISL